MVMYVNVMSFQNSAPLFPLCFCFVVNVNGKEKEFYN